MASLEDQQSNQAVAQQAVQAVAQQAVQAVNQQAVQAVQAVNQLTIKPTALQIDDKHVHLMIQNIQSVLNGKPLTPLNLLRVINSVFGTACSIKGLSERLQQTVIINALDNIIDQQADITPDDKEMLQQMLQTIVPEALEIAADIRNGLISLKKNSTCCTIM